MIDTVESKNLLDGFFIAVGDFVQMDILGTDPPVGEQLLAEKLLDIFPIGSTRLIDQDHR